MVNWFEKGPENEGRSGRHGGRPSVCEILPELLIGEYPRDSDVKWLRDTYHVTAVHNLQDDHDLAAHAVDIRSLARAYRDLGIALVRTPIPDGSADAMAEHLARALGDLHSLIESGKRVYMHCNGGVNRAPTLAIAYLRAHCGMSLDEALAHVKKRRACGPFMTVLEEYFGPRDFKPGR
ncbi:MAG: dual specificity protein phosphatase family protein [Candidatus Binataceae bacterium]